MIIQKNPQDIIIGTCINENNDVISHFTAIEEILEDGLKRMSFNFNIDDVDLYEDNKELLISDFDIFREKVVNYFCGKEDIPETQTEDEFTFEIIEEE